MLLSAGACSSAPAAVDRHLLQTPAPLGSKPAGRRCSYRSTGQTDGRTDRRTPDRYAYPAVHTMRAASMAGARETDRQTDRQTAGYTARGCFRVRTRRQLSGRDRAGQRHEMELATAAAITIKSFNVTEKSSGTTEQWWRRPAAAGRMQIVNCRSAQGRRRRR